MEFWWRRFGPLKLRCCRGQLSSFPMVTISSSVISSFLLPMTSCEEIKTIIIIIKGRQTVIGNGASSSWQQFKLNFKGLHTWVSLVPTTSSCNQSSVKFFRRDCRSQKLFQRTAHTKHFEEHVAKTVGQVVGTKFWSPNFRRVLLNLQSLQKKRLQFITLTIHEDK